VVRELADYNPAQYAHVTRLPLAEAIYAYQRRLRDDARHEYEYALLLYVIKGSSFGKHVGQPPAVPAILKEG
jgi:hypothetical protein